MALSPFAEQYKVALQDLRNIDRHSLSFLRDLAADNKDEHLNIIVAVQQQLYECTPQQQLPLLYLVDMIIKTVGDPYKTHFAPALPQMFRYVWQSAGRDLRFKLTKLASTWVPVLPVVTNTQVKQIMEAMDIPRGAAGTAAPEAMYSSRARMDPRLVSMSQPSVQQVPAYQPVIFPGRVTTSVPVSSVPVPPPQPAYAMLAPQPNIHGSAQTMFGIASGQQPGMHGHQAASSYSGGRNASTAATTQDLLSALMSLGSKLGAAKDHPVRSGVQLGAGRDAASGSPSTSGKQSFGKVMGSLTLSANVLKEYDQSAIDDLLDSTQQTRTKFLDIKFFRNRRIKAAQQANQPLTQQWFYTIDQWMIGARPDSADDLMLGPEDEEDGPNIVEEEYNVEEDPSQPECAISGEPFERWYDPDTDKWYYSGAILLTGDDAAAHDVMDGSIVKVNSLAGEPSKLLRVIQNITPGNRQCQSAAESDVLAGDLGGSDTTCRVADQATEAVATGKRCFEEATVGTKRAKEGDAAVGLKDDLQMVKKVKVEQVGQ